MALLLSRRVDENLYLQVGDEIITIFITKVMMGDQDVSKYIRASIGINASRNVTIWRDDIGNKRPARRLA